MRGRLSLFSLCCISLHKMSYLRILVFAIVVACSLYASFILVYKKVDAETVQHLRDVSFTLQFRSVSHHTNPSILLVTGCEGCYRIEFGNASLSV